MSKYNQSEARNLTMTMDFYELTMANAYFNDPDSDNDKNVVFDIFYRRNPGKAGFAIAGGLGLIIDYVNQLHFDPSDIDYLRSLNQFSDGFLDYLANFKFTGTIMAVKEGTIIYPNEPVITVVAPIVEAQLLETAMLIEFNHQSLIATKTQRIVKAAKGRPVVDFGARRAHNIDAADLGARAAIIGGCVGTADVRAAQLFDLPVVGTMAHSFIMKYGDEFTAFKKYAENYPDNTVLLVDTYDTIKSGIPNAIRVAKEVLEPMGKRLKGVRLDSGDLAYDSKKVRKMLDDAGCEDCKITVSNSLDEYLITSLFDQDAPIDSFGVGERMITASPEPVFGGVYKLSAVENKDGVYEPRIKVSGNVEKITNPGYKKLYRVYNEEGKAVADLLALADEKVDLSQEYTFVDPEEPWRKRKFVNFTARELQVPIFKDGVRVYEQPEVSEIAKYVKEQLENEIWSEEQRFENPHKHFLDMSPAMYKLKLDMLTDIQNSEV